LYQICPAVLGTINFPSTWALLSNGSMISVKNMRVQEANGCSRRQWWTQSDDYNSHGALWDNWPKNSNEGELIIFIEFAKNQKSPLYL
jgi:hypothetical protein